MLTMAGNHIDSRVGELHQPQSCASETSHVRERARRAMQHGDARCDGLPTDGGINRDPVGRAAADAGEEDELCTRAHAHVHAHAYPCTRERTHIPHRYTYDRVCTRANACFRACVCAVKHTHTIHIAHI